jgi:hypothetical protein
MDSFVRHQFQPWLLRLILEFRAISSFILGALDLGYWYTRTSTVFISVSGTVLVALSGIIAAVTHIANTVETEKSDFSTWSWLWLIVLTVATKFSLPFLMLKTVTRVEFSLNESTSIPSVRLVDPNHRERNSQRLDSRTSWGVKACVSRFLNERRKC